MEEESKKTSPYRENFEKGDARRKCFFDYWELCQDVWKANPSEEYFHSLSERVNAFIENHKDCDTFATNLGMALIATIEDNLKK